MFITSFGEQNITYSCCSNFLIHLCLTQDQLAIVLNLDSVETLNSLELDPDSSLGELAIILIRIAISLDALTGGEAKWMQHFMNVTQ
ncbi:hypothetical protein F972_00906 [Acinetobacter sp. CIP 102529]|nr:hypothetical protein F972_00906 [Acinetobacter sp. CIP 102529]